MNPTTAEIIAMALIKYGPSLARALVEIFQTETPTPTQWEVVFSYAEKSYDDYVKPTSASNQV